MEYSRGVGSHRRVASAGVAVAVAMLGAWALIGSPTLTRSLAAQDIRDAQEVDARTLAREALPAAVFEAVDRLAEDARREGVPVGPLYDKAVEGVAKGIPPERILPAVSARAERLRTVHRVWGPGADPSVLVAGVDALVKGVPSESLGQLGAPDRSAVSVLVLGDLVESGVLPDDAVGVVREAMAREAGEQDLLAIPATVRRLLRDGRTPGRAIDAVRDAIRDGRPVHRVSDVARDGGGGGGRSDVGGGRGGRGGSGAGG